MTQEARNKSTPVIILLYFIDIRSLDCQDDKCMTPLERAREGQQARSVTMSIEENKAIARHYIDLFNRGHLVGLDEVVASDVLDHYHAPGQAPGLEGLKQALARLRDGFPDMLLIIEDIIAEGDTVVVRGTGRGTHTGEFMNMPPTGKQVTLPVVAIYRIASGKIRDRWNLADNLGMMQQLGAIPGA